MKQLVEALMALAKAVNRLAAVTELQNKSPEPVEVQATRDTSCETCGGAGRLDGLQCRSCLGRGRVPGVAAGGIR